MYQGRGSGYKDEGGVNIADELAIKNLMEFLKLPGNYRVKEEEIEIIREAIKLHELAQARKIIKVLKPKEEVQAATQAPVVSATKPAELPQPEDTKPAWSTEGVSMPKPVDYNPASDVPRIEVQSEPIQGDAQAMGGPGMGGL